ncbi:hypothetical protein K458DRAFT_417683 [Lentithecium fluviatile CBS 122367]|uniref:Uncharacterized protein n=1 Tax=Lentithecium fluviatile CBS 122367 TaxID=1168545 RepID=A0A6G1J2R2_9PLEO|nr:hypothetical protein K458DRAFT_417683 [Lentithecium fluviatile CBS 122367]
MDLPRELRNTVYHHLWADTPRIGVPHVATVDDNENYTGVYFERELARSSFNGVVYRRTTMVSGRVRRRGST